MIIHVGKISFKSKKFYFTLQVASELNAAILETENRESLPKLASLLKLLLWSQDELDAKKVKYPKMTDLAKGEIEDGKQRHGL